MSIKNKLWYKLEKLVAEKLGLKRIGFSGGQWPLKEDNEDIDFICQCKDTENKSISIKVQDLEQLIKRAIIQHKIPIFAFGLEKIKYEDYKVWVAMSLDDFIENTTIFNKEEK